MSEIAVSVIVPVYNVEKYLCECLDSIVNQSLSDIEIICVNDGSMDLSKKILEEYKKNDSRIIVLDYHENKGQAYARNRGMEIARGEYIFFVDSDDKIKEGALADLYYQAQKDDVDGILFGSESFSEEGLEQYNDVIKTGHLGNRLSSGIEIFSALVYYDEYKPYVWRQFWNRGYLVEHQLMFQENTSPHEDILFSFKTIISATKIRCMNQIYYMYRRRKGSVTTTPANEKRIKAYIIVYFALISFVQEVHASIDERKYRIIGQYIRFIKSQARELCLEFSKNGFDLSTIRFKDSIYNLLVHINFFDGYFQIPDFMPPEVLQRIAQSKYIIVYGAGGVGREVINQLERYGFYDFFVAVSKKENLKNRAVNQKIYTLDELIEYRDECIILVSALKRHQEDMIQLLQKKGFNEYICMTL